MVGRNTLYTSKNVQNVLIEVCGHISDTSILDEVATCSKFFSIIADEATNSANDEQLAISIRHVNSRT